MSPAGNAWQRSLQAAESAGRLLNELGLDTTRQVDVFSMCEDLGLWLTFMPLDGLLGAFVPEGSGGVLITDQRPIRVQRYTAAHELGHWRLEHGHGLALDGEEHVFGATPPERERLAQVFAANLLMPPPFVLSMLSRIGIGDHGPIAPRDAYFVAREAGVSYEAAVRQLTNLQVITATEATSLLPPNVRPLAVKSALAGGRRPVYGYADVWPVDEAWNDQLISLRADDEVVLSLPENRSSGYRWMFDEEVTDVAQAPEPPPFGDQRLSAAATETTERFLATARTARRGSAPSAAIDRIRHVPVPDQAASPASERTLPGGMTIAGDSYLAGRHGAPQRPQETRRARLALAAGESEGAGAERSAGRPDAGLSAAPNDPEPLIAATGRRLLSVRFPDAGPKTLRLQHRSPYSDAPAVEEYVLHALVEPRRRGFSIDQLVDEPEEAWVGTVRDRQLHAPAPTIDDPDGD